MRNFIAKTLMACGYCVDSAEDGAVAWDRLQANKYDLLITDNRMPNVSGFKLIEKVRAAGMALPVIMATGIDPEEELTQQPWLRPAAVLLKPYSRAEFLGTVKSVLGAAVVTAMFLLCLPSATTAQNALLAPTGLRIVSADSVGRTDAVQPGVVLPHAVALSVLGKCECSDDGITFTKLERGRIFRQGMVIRTGGDAQADLFFGRSGTTVRLQAGTEVRLERIAVTIKDGNFAEDVRLDLRTGRIFTVVRSSVAGSTLAIRNPAGRSVVEGSGVGRYIITADGTNISDVGSVMPLKLIGENGTTIVAAGQQFTTQDGKLLPVSRASSGNDFVQLDELMASTAGLAAGSASPKP